MTFGNHRQRVPRELDIEIKSVFGYLLKKIRQFSRLYQAITGKLSNAIFSTSLQVKNLKARNMNR